MKWNDIEHLLTSDSPSRPWSGRCGQYADIIQSSLIGHLLPVWRSGLVSLSIAVLTMSSAVNVAQVWRVEGKMGVAVMSRLKKAIRAAIAGNKTWWWPHSTIYTWFKLKLESSLNIGICTCGSCNKVYCLVPLQKVSAKDSCEFLRLKVLFIFVWDDWRLNQLPWQSWSTATKIVIQPGSS